MKYSLQNTHVIITGASDGIGRALTEKLIVDYDCLVLGIARSADKLENLKSSLGDKAENFSYIVADVTDENFWMQFASSCEENDVNFDMLINNAGIMPPIATVSKTSCEVFDKILAVNYRAVYRATHAMLPLLRKSEKGAIVNIASSAALCPLAGTAAYSASKAATLAFTEALSAEEQDLFVTCACPGFTKTSLFRETNGFFDHKLIAFLSSTVDNMSKKIIRGIEKGKKRMVLGKDAKLMRAFHKVSPTLAAPAIRSVMKTAGMDIFGDLWD